MNHLSLGVGSDALRIIFDASDSKRKVDEDEENVEEPIHEIDISDLQRQSIFPGPGDNRLTLRIQASSSQILKNSKTKKLHLPLLDSNFLALTLLSVPPHTPTRSSTRMITMLASKVMTMVVVAITVPLP